MIYHEPSTPKCQNGVISPILRCYLILIRYEYMPPYVRSLNMSVKDGSKTRNTSITSNTRKTVKQNSATS